MASISKRGKMWQVRVSFKDASGTFRTKNKSGFKTKREAEAYANQAEVDRDSGTLVVEKFSDFPDYFWKWFETYKQGTVRERTELTYTQAHNILKEYFSGVSLADIDREKYQLFIKKYGKNHAKSTVSKMNSLFHACVKDALYDGAIKRDFITNIAINYNKDKTRKVQYLSVAQLERLLNYLFKTRNPHFTSKYMIITALVTGLRPGEIQGLRWQDINANFNTITVTQSWNETNKDFQELKNESSHRTIRVNKWLLDLLNELPKNDKLNRIFVNQYKTIPTSSAINKTLRDSLKANEIDLAGFHFHSCRHTHVAYLLSEGNDLYAISKRLGHSDITITAKVYAYLIDEYKAKTDNQIVTSLDSLLDNPQPNSSEANS
ncbi:site-specific integrase [Levilactobacillus brevis]|uniref:site-specific integrase n=1 Tax=Levilactobacillus brevis TaxID=1580 RepID=UPI0011195681|nr:site-specific integrase [Levilactobacillus brevis]QCZ50973.1 Phage integrase [Levilactobacillus brevis]QCZ51009.1 Phage integrase [Levilactobacillus brevis]